MADPAASPGAWVVVPLSGAGDTRECARMMAASEPWITLRRDEASALTVLRSPDKEVYGARDAAGVAGFVILDLHGPFPGYLQTICVRSDCRSRGLGTVLIQYSEARIFRDSPNVFLCVSSFNADAQRLYARLGYQVVGTLRGYVVPDHDEILMRKTRGSWTGFRQERRR